mmetsp:Transcript_14938/g.43918  ORF Transcript_14938/g.43918 Transcript_14938/m.43918 type:complete len:225 (-) Transcript_14938:965-1639(-)
MLPAVELRPPLLPCSIDQEARGCAADVLSGELPLVLPTRPPPPALLPRSSASSAMLNAAMSSSRTSGATLSRRADAASNPLKPPPPPGTAFGAALAPQPPSGMQALGAAALSLPPPPSAAGHTHPLHSGLQQSPHAPSPAAAAAARRCSTLSNSADIMSGMHGTSRPAGAAATIDGIMPPASCAASAGKYTRASRSPIRSISPLRTAAGAPAQGSGSPECRPDR